MNNFFGLNCVQSRAIQANFVYNSENKTTKYFVQYYVHYCKKCCDQFWIIVINIKPFDRSYFVYNTYKYCRQFLKTILYATLNNIDILYVRFRAIEGIILYMNIVQKIGQYWFQFWAIFNQCRCSKYVKIACVVRNIQYLSIYLSIARYYTWNCNGPTCRCSSRGQELIVIHFETNQS